MKQLARHKGRSNKIPKCTGINHVGESIRGQNPVMKSFSSSRRGFFPTNCRHAEISALMNIPALDQKGWAVIYPWRRALPGAGRYTCYYRLRQSLGRYQPFVSYRGPFIERDTSGLCRGRGLWLTSSIKLNFIYNLSQLPFVVIGDKHQIHYRWSHNENIWLVTLMNAHFFTLLFHQYMVIANTLSLDFLTGCGFRYNQRVITINQCIFLNFCSLCCNIFNYITIKWR